MSRSTQVIPLLLLAWIGSRSASGQNVHWEALVPVRATSEQGATLEILEDGSIRASGSSPDRDVHVVELETDLRDITGLRLEALPDDTLPGKGPGRSTTGNFVLNELVVAAGPRFSAGRPAPIDLIHPTSTYSQGGYPAVCAVDRNPDSGWAVRPRFGKTNVLVMETREDLGHVGGTALRCELSFLWGQQHVLGRYRFSATRSERPLASEPAPEAKQWPEVQASINAAVSLGVHHLLDQQELDGSWDAHQDRYPTGQTALTLYTLLKCGVSPEHPAVQRAVAFLRARTPVKTYSMACALLAFTALDDPADHRRLRDWTELLLAWQRDNGGYAYPDGAVDLSNTQYAALGLRAAAHHGQRIPAEVWNGLTRWVVSAAEESRGAYAPAGFSYHPGGVATSSMTAAGVSVLAICEEQLGRLRGEAATAKQRGLEWLARYFSVETNVTSSGQPSQSHLYYYLYGLERVGGLTGLRHIGRHDWYREGAAFLLEKQNDRGGFGDQSETCFGLLFLARATSSATGTVTSRTDSYGEDDPRADLSLRASGDTPLTIWISSFGEPAVEACAWSGEQKQGLRVREVRYYDYAEGEEDEPRLIATLPADPSRPSGHDRHAIQHEFERSGRFWVYAEVDVVSPTDEIVLLQSRPLPVRIREVLDPALLRLASDASRNLLSGARRTLTVSSEASDGFKADLSLDNLLATGWLSSDEDPLPTWHLELLDPIRASSLALCPTVPDQAERTRRIGKVSITVNGKKPPFELEISAGEPVKTELHFPRALLVRQLHIQVVEATPGQASRNGVGFAEVELRGASSR